MRKATDVQYFPYTSKTTCYIEVNGNGCATSFNHIHKYSRTDVLEAYQRVLNKVTTLYAVWPGEHRSDLFMIDDINKFAREFKLIN